MIAVNKTYSCPWFEPNVATKMFTPWSEGIPKMMNLPLNRVATSISVSSGSVRKERCTQLGCTFWFGHGLLKNWGNNDKRDIMLAVARSNAAHFFHKKITN